LSRSLKGVFYSDNLASCFASKSMIGANGPLEKSVLYREWILGAKGHSKAAELFGSLQISPESKTIDPDESCRRKAYLSALRASSANAPRDWPWRKSHGVGKSSLWPALRSRGGMTDFGCSMRWGVATCAVFIIIFALHVALLKTVCCV
jgi:hypothetical protein